VTARRAHDGGARDADLSLDHVRALRLGHGANCSSVGSVVDTLFVSAAVGGAIFAAVCAALRDEPVRIVGKAEGEADPDAEPDTANGRRADADADAPPPTERP
jgi:hypothetical protein